MYAYSDKSPVKAQIRRIAAEDHSSVIEIAKALPQWFTELGVQELTRDIQRHQGFVALKQGKVIGFATYHVANDEKTAELSWIGVRPEFHRTGIGRALVNAIEADLAQRGVQALVVSTVASTVEYEPYARTRRFYRAIGFSNVRVDRKWYPSRDDRLLLRKQSSKKPHVQNQAY